MQVDLTEVVWWSQGGENTGEELQTDLDLRTVAVPATQTRNRMIYPKRLCSSVWLLIYLCTCGTTSFHLTAALSDDKEPKRDRGEQLTDSQCKLVPLISDFLDVVLQIVEEQLHHVQLLLSPPDTMRPASVQHLHASFQEAYVWMFSATYWSDLTVQADSGSGGTVTHIVIQWVS